MLNIPTSVLFLLCFSFQVDLGSIHKITAIATQGMTGLFVNAWVFGYKLQGSNSARAYSWVTHVQVSRLLTCLQ